MDNDDLRRGRPTCHRAYDEATAILVGDALQALAFAVLASEPPSGASSPSRLEMIRVLARATGTSGMAGMPGMADMPGTRSAGSDAGKQPAVKHP